MIVIELVGGPADGQRHALEGDTYSPTFHLSYMPEIPRYRDLDLDEMVPVQILTYKQRDPRSFLYIYRGLTDQKLEVQADSFL